MSDEQPADYPQDELLPDCAVLVRGGPLDFDRLRDAAMEPKAPHGFCGISMFAFPNVDDPAEIFECSPLRYPEICVVTAREIREAGFEVKRTFRKRGHCSLIFAGDPTEGDIGVVMDLLEPSYTLGGEQDEIVD